MKANPTRRVLLLIGAALAAGLTLAATNGNGVQLQNLSNQRTGIAADARQATAKNGNTVVGTFAIDPIAAKASTNGNGVQVLVGPQSIVEYAAASGVPFELWIVQ
ncbi:MAG: hypothetical protein PWP23_146 [Candidatus Sumerlaeota bacterium]|nr:hypothetical protein [Candidatus Sumerlaeota bacterium]